MPPHPPCSEVLVMNGKTGGQVTFPTVGCVSVRSLTGSCDTARLIWGFGWLVGFFSTRCSNTLSVFAVSDGKARCRLPTEVTGRFWVSHGSGSPHLGLFSIRGRKTLNIRLFFRTRVWCLKGEVGPL